MEHVAHTCDPGIWEVEAGESVEGHPQPLASLRPAQTTRDSTSKKREKDNRVLIVIYSHPKHFRVGEEGVLMGQTAEKTWRQFLNPGEIFAGDCITKGGCAGCNDCLCLSFS